LGGKKLGGSRYGDLAVAVPLLDSASCDGRLGDRHVRLNDACKGEAAVDMAPLREHEKRLGADVEDSGGGAIDGKRCDRVRPPPSTRAVSVVPPR